ncbi:MAG: bifunctional oligoribonuclease/PAP phosphatase NrnA [Deltaproteobacteria bacterium]|jgi:phosphoesterase RecJ-like protein|nr:bifunctional oligoribonuclease/PAP phosphatase NrnA [Deltaproteobacteria bacterium]
MRDSSETKSQSHLPRQGASGPSRATPRFIERLLNGKRILILGHHNPDGDALGSAVALGLALRALGKEASVGVSGFYAHNIAYLLEGLDFVVDIPSPLALGEFDLLVYVDCHGPERAWEELPRPLPPFPPHLVIDHHVLDGELRQALDFFHDREASSAGEIVCRLLQDLNVAFTPPIVQALLAAICSDTGFFTQANASAAALAEASFLVSLGGSLEETHARLKQGWSLAKTRLLGLCLASMELHRGGEVATMVLTEAMLRESGAALAEAEGFIDYARALKGVKLAALVKCDGRGRTKVSLRSRRPYSARAVATRFGGGGHSQAAAYTENSPDVALALSRFLEALETMETVETAETRKDGS